MENGSELLTDKSNTNANYPSAELLQNICYEEYRRVLGTYDKIYEKVNIALAFSGIILLVVMSSFDYTIICRIVAVQSSLELFSLLMLLLCSLASTVLIVWSVIQLLLLIRSKELTVFDSIAVRNEELYRETKETASVWLIDKYTQSVAALRPEIRIKQKSFDSAILKIVIGLICFAVVMVIQKGMIA